MFFFFIFFFTGYIEQIDLVIAYDILRVLDQKFNSIFID